MVGHLCKKVLGRTCRVWFVLDDLDKGSGKWGIALDWRLSGNGGDSMIINLIHKVGGMKQRQS